MPIRRIIASAAVAAALAACQSGPSKEELEAAKNTVDCRHGDERIIVRFEEARALPDGPARTKLFDRMTQLVIAYAPFRMTYHVLEDSLRHPWVGNYVPHPIRSQVWMYVDVKRHA